MQQNLEGNIKKYNLLKIFTKRVFLPLIAIFLTTVGGVTLPQLGIIASVTGLVSLILEVPTGYLADKWGHKNSLIFGSLLCTLSVLPYIFMPSFWGGLIGTVVFFVGGSFSSGTVQAFMHETLLSLGRESEYTKIMGRAQSYGLLGNVILVALVPLTYSLNPLLPFIIGFFCLLIGTIITATFVSPPAKIHVQENFRKALTTIRRSLSKNALVKLLLIFTIFGISSAAFDASIIYREIVFKDLNIPVAYFGFILAISSLLAAITGKYIHHLKKLTPSKFYLFDILYVSIAFILIGITRNPTVIVMAFVLFPTYDRTRNIIFESQLFEEFSGSNYKATLVSIMNFFPLIANMIISLVLTVLIAKTNLFIGHSLFGIFLAIILLSALFAHNFIASKK